MLGYSNQPGWEVRRHFARLGSPGRVVLFGGTVTDDRLSREAIFWRTLAMVPSGAWVWAGVGIAWTPDVDVGAAVLGTLLAVASAPTFFDGVLGLLLGLLLLAARAQGGQAAVDELRAAWRAS